MYREMVEKISAVVDGGKKVEDIVPGDVLTIDASKIAKLVRRDAKTRTTGADGDVTDNIRFKYVEHREQYMLRKDAEQWCDEVSDRVILTLAGRAYRPRATAEEKQQSYDQSIALHHAWDAAFETHKKCALVTVNTNSDAPDPAWFETGREDVFEVVAPRSWDDDTATTAAGVEYRKCGPEWLAFPDEATILEIDGIQYAAMYKMGDVTIVRLLAVPADLFDSAGKMLLNANMDRVATWCDMIAGFTCGQTAAAVVDDSEPTEEDKQQYESAKLMISMVKAAVSGNQGKLRELKQRVERHNTQIETYMNTIVTEQRAYETARQELNALEGSTSGAVAQATGKLLSEYELISNDPPVKKARLFERGGATMLEVELVPLVIDAEEQEMKDSGQWADARGVPQYRLLDRLKFEMNLSAGTVHIAEIMKWLHPTDTPDGFDTRCHPHAYTDGRSCWGQLETPFAEAVGKMNWHDAVQWIYNYCANVRTDEPHHTQQWRFKPAPEGWTPGWITPDMTEQVTFLETYAPTPTYDQ